MKIGLLHPYLENRGGSQRYALEIANTFTRMGHDVTIFCFCFDATKCYPELNSKLRIHSVQKRSTNPNVTIKKGNGFFSILKKIIGIPFFLKAYFFFGFDYLYSLLQTRRRSIEFANFILGELNNDPIKLDILFTHEEPLSIYSAIRVKTVVRIPIYWFCYDTIQKWFFDWLDASKKTTFRSFILNKIFFTIDKFLVRKNVDQYAVLDLGMQKRFFSMYKLLPLVRFGGINSSVLEKDRSDFIRLKYKLSDDCLIVCAVTRFLPYKRIEDILSLRRHLNVAGIYDVFIYVNAPVSDIEYFDRLCQEFNDVVKCDGIVIETNNFTSDEMMYQIYLSSDIFVFPNERQTWGHAAIEAMACRCVAVVSDGCGISELISSVTPTVFSTGNVKDLTNLVLSLRNRTLLNSLALLQFGFVSTHLVWDSICRKYIEDFKRMIKK